jgi:hypothetical protein
MIRTIYACELGHEFMIDPYAHSLVDREDGLSLP